jgi:hypothetical protein
VLATRITCLANKRAAVWAARRRRSATVSGRMPQGRKKRGERTNYGMPRIRRRLGAEAIVYRL